MELFKLFGTLALLGVAEAQKDIEGTSEKASGLGDKLKKGIETAAKWGAAIAAGASAASGALLSVATSAASTTDNIDKMSQKIGISREAYQELAFICSQSGTSVDTLQMGVKTLTGQMQSAADGTASAAAMFEKLGVSIYDDTGALKDQEAMMWEAMSALQSMENQTEKAALATDLFGRSGTELMPLLNGASGSIEAMKEQAHELGLILSDESVDAGVLFTDTMDQVKRSFGAIVTEIGVGVMPIFQQLLEWVIANMPQIQAVMGAVFSVLEAVVSEFGGIMTEVFGLLSSWLGSTNINFAEVFANIQTIFEKAWMLLQEIWAAVGQPIFDLLLSLLGTLRETFAQYMPEIQAFVQQCFTDIQTFWNANLKPCLEAIGNFISTVLAPVFQSVFSGFIAPAVETAFNFIKSLWETVLKPVFTGITDFLTGVFTLNFEQAFEGLLSIVKGVANGIIGGIETMINGAISAVNGLIEGLNKLVGIAGSLLGLNFSIPTIGLLKLPRLEKGGILDKGQVGLLEGKGAEAVVPLDQNSAWISAVARDMEAAGIGGNSQQAQRIIDLLEMLIEMLPDTMKDAFASMKFDINNREFARMVKAV